MPGLQLRQQVGDITEGVTFTPALNGHAIAGGHSFDEEETAGNCEVINGFAERLTRVPADARSVLELVVAKGSKGYGLDEEFRIPEPVLKGLADCSLQQLRERAEVLDYFGLLYIDIDPIDGGPPQYVVRSSTQAVGWPLLQDIREHLGDDHAVLRRILCDLDFSVLDG
jgi:hypothetical protein